MSHTSTSLCTVCKNRPSISLCIGCKRDLCPKCFDQHRNDLSRQLDELVNRRNDLVQTMNTYLSKDKTNKCSYFDEINRWQKEMHANIDRVAERAKENAQQSFTSTSQTVQYDLEELSKDLQQRQQSGGYVENDLQQIRQQLDNLNTSISNFNKQIHIDTNISKTIPWDSLIIVVSKNNPVSQPSPPPPYFSPSAPLENLNQPKSFVSAYTPQEVKRSDVVSYASMPYETNRSNSVHHSSIPPQRNHSNQSTPQLKTKMDHSHQNPNGNRLPLHSSYSHHGSKSGHTPSLTFTCIGCKTVNNKNPSGQSYCSNCKSPAWF